MSIGNKQYFEELARGILRKLNIWPTLVATRFEAQVFNHPSIFMTNCWPEVCASKFLHFPSTLE
jgi:hypothetical protein